MPKILLAEDDLITGASMRDCLSANHTVEWVIDGTEAFDRLKFYKYDIAIIDWDLPGLNGVEVCRQIRQMGSSIPVLMLTGKSSLDEKETGLDSGADDYLTKPCHMREVEARIRALTRRSNTSVKTTIEVSGFRLDLKLRSVFFGELEITLLPKEFALLEFLMRNPNEVFSCEAILERVWSSESQSSPNTIRTFMYTLRKKLQSQTDCCPIETVHGAGYKFCVR